MSFHASLDQRFEPLAPRQAKARSDDEQLSNLHRYLLGWPEASFCLLP